ncbi:glycosyltransferase family 2 protein [Patescibacteria group bacterium]|nr:glycosyltransferase family 2 protein [Patescibacteria group bacterium]
MLNKIFVVIPVHNRLEYSKKCLTSFKNQTYKNFEVIVVDDGSGDGTSNYIKKRYPQYTVIKGPGDWWWAKSMATGIEYALKNADKNDFILSMNNDCYFNKEYLREILKKSISNNYAIVGSIILDSQNPTRVIEAGIKINWRHALIYGIADNISNDIRFYTDRVDLKEIDTLPGKGTLFPVRVVKKVGNFNYKRLPHYIADYEFFCRAKKHGFKLVVSSRARLYNFAKKTGTSHVKKHTGSYKEVLNVLFGRKSKLNIMDHTNFLLLACPHKYLLRNFMEVSKKIRGYALMLFPFYYIKIALDIYYRGKMQYQLLLHNIPIYFRQNPILSKLNLTKTKIFKKR